VYDASAHVFESRAPLVPEARETLKEMRDAYRLAVLTKGDSVVQSKRLADSGLLDLLDAVCIVDEKDDAAFSSILAALDAEPGQAWSVGNSYGSDVHPAVQVGMRAVWIDAEVWAHERSLSFEIKPGHDPDVFVAKRLREVPGLIEAQPAQRPG
jgi:putative hydrolase of the HAD superfamily